MRRTFWLISIVIIELFVIFNCISRIVAILQSQKRIAEFKIQRDILAKRYEEKQAQFEFVKTDTYAEKIAREKLGFAREGDVVYIVPPAKEKPVTLPEIEVDESSHGGFVFGEVGNWWKLFFG